MTWADLDTDTALERDILRRTLALAETSSTRSSHVIDMEKESVGASISGAGFHGQQVTPAACIDLLQVRPLLFGTAWKVFDITVERALAADNKRPKEGIQWRISDKVKWAKNASVTRPTLIWDADIWKALMHTYADASEMRHSLTHRRVEHDLATGSLIGYAEGNGQKLDPITVVEQVAFGRAALRTVELLTATTASKRAFADLRGQLYLLARMHPVHMPATALQGTIPCVTAIIDPSPTDGTYILDMTKLRRLQPFKESGYVDVRVHLRDRPGFELEARLEDMPDCREWNIDVLRPPDWLRVASAQS